MSISYAIGLSREFSTDILLEPIENLLAKMGIDDEFRLVQGP